MANYGLLITIIILIYLVWIMTEEREAAQLKFSTSNALSDEKEVSIQIIRKTSSTDKIRKSSESRLLE